MIIHLNGWPGAGKRTVGEVLARILPARFVHNHLLHDVGLVCAGLESPDRWPVYEQVRTAAYAALANLPKPETLVMTNALSSNSSREVDAWRHVVDLGIRRGVPLIPVVLQLTLAENQRRIVSDGRGEFKLRDPEKLASYLEADALQVPDVAETFVLDVTCLKPEEAAREIEAHVLKSMGTMGPATSAHLRFRT